MNSKENLKSLWNGYSGYQVYAITNSTIDSTTELIEEAEPVNSGAIQSTLFSEGFDCQLDESDLNEMNQDDENNIE
ncbi:kinase-like domain-containing protein [Rhizophagus irregularis DAOM 181602=DAOM 197198]|nr:kinase-like domain-containing protein [Rhizophagus irregularis DAOM 181602=DAOM 197198]